MNLNSISVTHHMIAGLWKIPEQYCLCCPILEYAIFTVFQTDKRLCQECNPVFFTYYHIVRERFESPEANRFFHTEKLVQLLDDHRAGKADNSRKIWTLYIFLVWYQIYFPESCGA